jgi:hypothetical protein
MQEIEVYINWNKRSWADGYDAEAEAYDLDVVMKLQVDENTDLDNLYNLIEEKAGFPSFNYCDSYDIMED